MLMGFVVLVEGLTCLDCRLFLLVGGDSYQEICPLQKELWLYWCLMVPGHFAINSVSQSILVSNPYWDSWPDFKSQTSLLQCVVMWCSLRWKGRSAICHLALSLPGLYICIFIFSVYQVCYLWCIYTTVSLTFFNQLLYVAASQKNWGLENYLFYMDV
jgi:hypothetical protein